MRNNSIIQPLGEVPNNWRVKRREKMKTAKSLRFLLKNLFINHQKSHLKYKAKAKAVNILDTRKWGNLNRNVWKKYTIIPVSNHKLSNSNNNLMKRIFFMILHFTYLEGRKKNFNKLIIRAINNKRNFMIRINNKRNFMIRSINK